MKKLLVPALCATLLLGACQSKSDDEKAQEQALQDASKQELATAVADRDQLLGLVNEISSGMDQIKRLENILTVTNGMKGETASQRAQIQADIAAIQQTLQQRREQLADLEAKLNKSNVNNASLRKTIETLRGQINSQSAEIETLRANLDSANRTIGTLTASVDSLNTTVTTVTGERDAAQQESTELTNELNTCYYVAASNKELKDHKIIESGFLRKTKLMKGDFDQSFFTVGDKRTLTSLPLHSKKARVLSNQPAASYQIVDEGGQKVLKITNPDLFWSLSNYLVIKID
ncbi:MAG: hypothetical protein NC406_07650 [Bacteroides sp.]|nr:hypothetical protein [Bacteroides sp.]MCM1096259.1 hypothetical protein [Terasakiella sp.]